MKVFGGVDPFLKKGPRSHPPRSPINCNLPLKFTEHERCDLKKIKLGIGAILMAAATLLCDRADIILLYALSAALHECGHLLAARVLGVGVKEIKFEFSGVRICTDESICSYKKEFILAAAGPLVNLAIITVVIALFSIWGISLIDAEALCEGFLSGEEYTTEGALGFVAISSVLQGGINLLPVRTFDGGRMAYCLSAILFGERRATQILDVFSAFSAFVLWTVALYLMLKISSGLGIYVFSACLFLSTFEKGNESKI